MLPAACLFDFDEYEEEKKENKKTQDEKYRLTLIFYFVLHMNELRHSDTKSAFLQKLIKRTRLSRSLIISILNTDVTCCTMAVLYQFTQSFISGNHHHIIYHK